jgi:tetratricopeptide (TPR) repeat protein
MAHNEEIGDRQGLGLTFGGLAAAWAKKGNADKAIEYYEQAATIQREIGDRYHLCMTLSGLARVAKHVGNTQLAESSDLEMKRLGCRQR